MIALIEDNREAIAALCREHGVRRLAVFGSAAKGTFDPDTSDIDFVVDYFDWSTGIFHRFFGLIVALEELLGRKVDMTSNRSVNSDWFKRELAETAQTIYAADSTAAA